MSDSMADVDCAVLSDVLAFLDGFEGSQTDPGESQSSVADSDASPGSLAEPQASLSPVLDPGSASNPREKPRAPVMMDKKSKDARPRRLDRYWNKKHEMKRLRGEVEYLGNKLDLLRQCARSPDEIKVTSALGVTIRKVCHRRLTTWKRLAAHELAMRERAEDTNAKLRELLRYQQRWTGAMEGDVAQAAEMLAKNRRIASIASPTRAHTPMRTAKSRLHDAKWGEILWQLYAEAYAFATGEFIATVERFDWTSPPRSEERAKPLLEWTTTFPVPRRDPRSAGDLWRQYIEDIPSLSCSKCENANGIHQGVIPRLEKSCKWSLLDKTCNQEVKAASITLFEKRQSDDGLWILASTATVYDASETAVLFRSESSIVVMPRDAQSCVVRAHYRIHSQGATLTPSDDSDTDDNDGEKAPTAVTADATVAIKNFVSILRNKDHELQRALLRM